ncbi:MAG TPA: S41 family peptidase, partial [Blastocatellia bacterium]|nr:S41 family peptidase [Blastocatellia bacterium]
GEYQLHVRPVGGDEPVKKINIEPKPSFYRELTWSPDSKRIAFTDKRLALWLADVEAGKASRIDSSTYSYQEQWFPQWSPDSRYLTYSRHLKNRVRTVFIYDVAAARVHQVTDGLTHSELPIFDASGKYLYFVSSPNVGTSEYGWGVLKGVLARPGVARRLHVAVLEEGAAAPLLPNGMPNPDVQATQASAAARIDFDHLAERIVDVPGPARDYALLQTGKPGVLFAQVLEWPPSPNPLGGNPSQTLYKYELSSSPRMDKFVEGINAFETSRDGARLLYLKGPNWYIVSADAAPKADDGKLDLSKLEVSVDPAAEWKQMYHEAWRVMRDWFYDSNHHGLNLAELESHYAEYLPSTTRRSDLNALFNRMLGHVSVSHLGVGGGDVSQPGGPPVRSGLLGADYEIANGRYRFKRVYRSTNYASTVGTVTAPLDRPGLRVREGEYLIAIDGQNVDATKSVYSYFENKGPQAKISVGPNPDGQGARTFTVFLTQSETPLRAANWVEANRHRVEQASGGRLGYIYCGDYGTGILDFIRGLSGYSDRDGVIIDQRYNGGGITPDYLIEWLQRKPLYYYTFREGDDIATPVNPGPAVKVLIINDENFSAAETFAFMYKLGKVGPIVGQRTGGGGIGPYVFTPRFIDGGRVQLPNRAAYNPDGTSWGIENTGVSPDFEVEITPKDYAAGRDSQLEKAIQVALDELKSKSQNGPKKPKYPVHP